MDCSNCGQPVSADQAFCGVCGTRVEVAPPPVPEAVAPTQPMPPQPPGPAAPPAYDPAAYQQQYAPQPGYEQPYAQQPYAQPGYQQPYAQSTPPRKKKTGLIIALVAVGAVVIIGAIIGGIVILRGLSGYSGTTASSVTDDPGTGAVADAPGEGYDTPEEALAAVFPADWVFSLQTEDSESMTYWVGPPNSEYTDEVVVEKMTDGSWVVTEDIPLDTEFDDGGLLPEDEAVATVMNFLDLIMQDRPAEAQQLCVPPFSEDPASAAYSNGDFIGYEIEGVVAQDDMTFWVHVSEEWRWGVEEFEYYVVPTELGYYISELRPY